MMTSQLLGVKDTPGLTTERNNLGLSDCSSVDSSNVSGLSEVNKSSLGLKATELRIGIPGSRSPDRDPESSLTSTDKLEEKPLFHFLPSSPKKVVSGHKRVFTDTMDSCSKVKGLSDGNWMFGGSAMESDSLKSLGQGKFSSNSNVNGIALLEASKMAQVTSGTKLNKVNSSNTLAAK
ncbi:auxin-responsive protein IAA9-like protein [Tanacetum coccineum]